MSALSRCSFEQGENDSFAGLTYEGIRLICRSVYFPDNGRYFL